MTQNIKAQLQLWIIESIPTNTQMIFLQKPKNFWSISNTVWDKWVDTILGNQSMLSQAKSYDELYKLIEDLKIKGIGVQSLIWTTNQFAYNNDIPLDDSCWHCIINRNLNIKKIGTTSTEINNFFDKLSPEANKLTTLERMNFISLYLNKIMSLLRETK